MFSNNASNYDSDYSPQLCPGHLRVDKGSMTTIALYTLGFSVAMTSKVTWHTCLETLQRLA